jgi:CDP-diacylglycerol---serine O-phosphatidyltransferase
MPLRRRKEDRPGRFRRGVFLLPSMFTVANLFCGYACVVYSTQSDFDTAALFIGIAMVLDTLDGFVARLTKSSTAFGVELDSLADVVSFGLAPAILAFTWGLWPLKRLGWAAGFIYVTAAAMRLARFNIQTAAATDKRYFVGMPSPAAASVIASTVYLYPYGLQERETALPALAMVLVPALLMVSTIRFRSVKAIDVGWRLASPRRAGRVVVHVRRGRLGRLGSDAVAQKARGGGAGRRAACRRRPLTDVNSQPPTPNRQLPMPNSQLPNAAGPTGGGRRRD